MKILMICKHNRFRSKVAETFFKKLNKDKKIKVRSRATQPDYIPVSENVKKVLRKFGIRRIDSKPRKLSKRDLNWADLIVVAANNVRLKVKNKKVLIWKISDTNQEDLEGIEKRVEIIRKRVLSLINRLDKKV